MNVQEINESGHSVWAFVVCAIAMWLVTAGVWMAWQARRNYKVAEHRALAHNPWIWKLATKQRREYRASSIRDEYSKPGGRLVSLLYYLGLRRLERSGRTAV